MAADYTHNHYYIGQPLTGKDTALINSVLDDLEAGLGLIVIDPHGSTINKILARYPKKRDKHLIIFDPSDSGFPIAFNPLEFDHPDDIPNIVSFLLESMKAMAKYDGAATTNFDLTINTTAFATMSHGNNTLLAMLMFLTDKSHRQKVLKTVIDPLVAKYWNEFEKRSEKRKEEIIGSAISHLTMLMLDPRLRNILGQKTSAFRLKEILSNKTVLLIKLPITELGRDKTFTLGALCLSQIFGAIGKRNTERPFPIYIPGVHRFASPALVTLLSIAPEYNVGINFSHDYLSQLSQDVQDAFIGSSTYKTIFRLSLSDAEIFEKTMAWDNTRAKLYELETNEARLVREATVTQEYMPDLGGNPDEGRIKELVRLSRQRYAIHKKQIEGKLDDFIGGEK